MHGCGARITYLCRDPHPRGDATARSGGVARCGLLRARRIGDGYRPGPVSAGFFVKIL